MTVSARIVELYGEGFLRKSVLSIRDGGGVFEEILCDRQYKTILEIGTYRGVSAAEMAQYCDKVITIDLKRGKLEKNRDDFNRYELWHALGVKNIELHLIADDKEKARLIDGLEFDFAFIDGAHDETVSNDFRLVRKCGAVLFHDYSDRGSKGKSHVKDFVDSIPDGRVEVFDIFAFWTK